MLGLKLRVLGLRLSNDKQGLSMKAKVLCVSLVVAQSLWAMNVDRHTFYTRDYLDFGQNLGQFTPGAKNLSIVKKNGEVVALPDLPFPDFSKFDGSNRTSVGGAYTASSKHVVTANRNGQTIELKKNFSLGDSNYSDRNIKTYWGDSAFTRVDKFIVEGGYKATSFHDVKNNATDYTTNYQGEDRIIVYRSGSGLMSFGDWQGGPKASESVKSPGVAGGLFYLKAGQIEGVHGKLLAYNGNYGPLKGVINTGDSGSPIFVFNNKTQEWELIGTSWGGNQIGGNKVSSTFFGIVRPTELDNFKKQFEVQKVANGAYDNTKDKDSVYTESGTIVINDEVQQGMGGIILRGGGVKRLTLQAAALLKVRG